MARAGHKGFHVLRKSAFKRLRSFLPHERVQDVSQELFYQSKQRGFDAQGVELPQTALAMNKMWHGEQDEAYVRLYEGDVSLEGRSGLVLCNGRVVWGSSDYAVRERSPRFMHGVRNGVRTFDELMSFHHAFDSNYFHFFNNVMLKLKVIDDLGLSPHTPIVFSAALAKQPFFEQALSLGILRGRPHIVHAKHETLNAKRIYTVKAFDVDFDATQWLIEPLVQQVDASANENAAYKRVFLVRGKHAPNARHFRNMAQLDDVLAQHNVQKVDPQELTLAQQIQMFRAAELIISPHGAGLTNLMFCRPSQNVHVVELFNPSLGSPHYYMFSQQRGLKYSWCMNLDEMGKENVASSNCDLGALENIISIR